MGRHHGVWFFLFFFQRRTQGRWFTEQKRVVADKTCYLFSVGLCYFSWCTDIWLGAPIKGWGSIVFPLMNSFMFTNGFLLLCIWLIRFIITLFLLISTHVNIVKLKQILVQTLKMSTIHIHTILQQFEMYQEVVCKSSVSTDISIYTDEGLRKQNSVTVTV